MRRTVAILGALTFALTAVAGRPSPAEADPPGTARWDHANLTFWVEGGTGNPERQAVRDAFAGWQKAGVVAFSEVGDLSRADIKIAWSTYGPDGRDLGPCRTRPAVTFAPGETPAGEVTLNSGCNWGTAIDLRQIASREIGRALGLAYTDDPMSVMYRGYRLGGPTTAGDSDLDALRRLYGVSRFVGVDPLRVLDTRNGTGMPGGAVQPLGEGQRIDLWLAGAPGTGVPVGATAVVVNVTLTDGSDATYVTAFPTGPVPLASNLNSGPWTTIANLATVKLNPSGWVSFFNAKGTADVVVDLAGYYTADLGAGSGFNGLTPTRVLDTRFGPGPVGAVGAGRSLDLQLAGVAGVPAGATSVVVNITSTDTSAGSYVTAWPAGKARPVASNLNPRPGRAVPNLATVKLGRTGAISLFNAAGSLNLVVDLVGYYDPRTGADFVATAPERVLDTRTGEGPIGPGATTTWHPSTGREVPATALGVVANFTATEPTSASYLTVFPQDVTRPTASTLNFNPGDTVANLAAAKLGTDGNSRIFNAAGTTHVISDVSGYFTARGQAPSGVGIGSDASGATAPAEPSPPRPPAPQVDSRWDHNNLTYWFGSGIGAPERQSFRDAFAAWQRAGILSFREVSDAADADLRVVFYTYSRNARPFTDCAQELGESFVPGTAHGGEINLNGRCSWATTAAAGGYDLRAVASREIGHALGLPYTDTDAGSVLFTGYRGARDVAADDLQRLRRHYGATRFVAVSPARLLDTRSSRQRLGPNGRVDLHVRGPVPATASAAVLSITATDPTVATYISAFPSDVGLPTTSVMNPAPGRTTTNATTVKLSSAGDVALFNAAGSVDLVVDVVGYYTTDFTVGAGFRGAGPARVLDTRTGLAYAGPLNAGAVVPLAVAGTAGVPADATAVVLNLTSSGTTGPTYVTVYPTGEARPLTTSLTPSPGEDIAAAATVKVGAHGFVSFYNAAASTNLVVDVVGYYTATGGTDFVPVSPVRALDTTIGQTSDISYRPSADRRVPTVASALVANLTASAATAATFVTVWPDGAGRPSTSTMNVRPGTAAANQATSAIGPAGGVRIYNAAGTIRMMVDLSGYFTGN